MKIRNFHKSDFSSVKSIYQQGIDTGNATFQKKAKAWNEWNLSFLSSCRIVAEMNGEVVGWAALSPASNRAVYNGVAEVSIYIQKIMQTMELGIHYFLNSFHHLKMKASGHFKQESSLKMNQA